MIKSAVIYFLTIYGSNETFMEAQGDPKHYVAGLWYYYYASVATLGSSFLI